MILLGQKAHPKNQRISILPERSLRNYLKLTSGTDLRSTREKLDGFSNYVYSISKNINQLELTEKEWIIEEESLIHIINKITKNNDSLLNVEDVIFYSGLKTGLNNAFIISSQERSDILYSNPQSESVIRPLLRGRGVQRWRSNWDDEYLILLQSSTDKDCPHSWRLEKSEKSAFQKFESEHPLVARHLQQFEKDLRKRSDKGKFWWELRSCAYYSAFTADKIVWGKYGDSPDSSGMIADLLT